MSLVSRRRLRQAAEAGADTAHTDPAHTDPAHTDPAHTDPDVTGPVPVLPPLPAARPRTAPTAGLPYAGLPDAGLLDVARAERSELISALLWLRERLTSVALLDRVEQALFAAGLTRADVYGTVFDPSWQEAGLLLDTSDPALVGTVAAVESDGWYDHGQLVRHPVVSIYRLVPR